MIGYSTEGLAEELGTEPTALQVDTYRAARGIGLSHAWAVYAATIVPVRARQAECTAVGFLPPDPWGYR